jgi:hypothetical protein
MKESMRAVLFILIVIVTMCAHLHNIWCTLPLSANVLSDLLGLSVSLSVLFWENRHSVIRAGDHHLSRLQQVLDGSQSCKCICWTCKTTYPRIARLMTAYSHNTKLQRMTAQIALGFGSMVCCTLCLAKRTWIHAQRNWIAGEWKLEIKMPQCFCITPSEGQHNTHSTMPHDCIASTPL